MTIKKKDGNVYTLEGPNKLAKNQEKIDLSKCVFHNFKWEELVWNSKRTKQPVPVQPVPVQPVPVQPVPVQPEQDNSNQVDINFPVLKVKVLMHCLPAKIKTSKDKFYGESWQSISYGNKFIFPSVILSNNDLQLEFWTSDPKNKIEEKSIIYPFSYEIYNQETNSYDRVPFDEYRWWKITNKEQKEEGGYLFTASPSEDHPDFSD